MMQTIQALIVLTGRVETLKVRRFDTGYATSVYAFIAGSEKFAELDLTRPEEGWKVFPD
jgi:hypothetical protein